MSAVAFVEFLFDLHNSQPVLKSALISSAEIFARAEGAEDATTEAHRERSSAIAGASASPTPIRLRVAGADRARSTGSRAFDRFARRAFVSKRETR